MDASIRMLTLAEEADALARQAVETRQEQPNPYKGKAEEDEFARRYYIALLRHSAPTDCEATA